MSIIPELLGEMGPDKRASKACSMARLVYAWVNNKETVSNKVQDEGWRLRLSSGLHTHSTTHVHSHTQTWGLCSPMNVFRTSPWGENTRWNPALQSLTLNVVFWFCLWSAEVWTQPFLHARPVLYCWAIPSSTIPSDPHFKCPYLQKSRWKPLSGFGGLTMFLCRLSKLPRNAPPRKHIHLVQLS